MHNRCDSHSDMRHGEGAQELLNSILCRMDYTLGTGRSQSRIAYFAGVDLQNIAIYRMDNVGIMKSYRTRKHILSEASRDFLISIPLSLRSLVTHAGKQSVCEPSTFRLLSTSVPFSAYSSGAQSHDRSSGLAAKISGAMLRQLVPNIDDYPDLVLKIRPGAGKLMKSLFETALAEGGALPMHQAHDFGKTIIHAIANAVLDAPGFELRQALVHQSSYERVLESAKNFIESNLSNPSLDCTLVAEHCQVSNTYLHEVFASSSTKVSGYIRELRLQQCRANFLDPKLRHRTITEIMMNWGFIDASAFTRTYRARFGRTPSEERGSRTPHLSSDGDSTLLTANL